jgi:hypothetical protein
MRFDGSDKDALFGQPLRYAPTSGSSLYHPIPRGDRLLDQL